MLVKTTKNFNYNKLVYNIYFLQLTNTFSIS